LRKNINVIYQSDRLRAKETTEIILSQIGLVPKHTLSGLNELSLGDYEGKRFKELREIDPNFINNFIHNPERIRPPNGESGNDFRDRVLASFERILRASHGSTIVLVCHEGPIKLIICYLLRMHFRHIWNLEISPGSITFISIDKERIMMRFLNYIPEVITNGQNTRGNHQG
jgi:broad specificity phosphatase PhoE